MKTAKLIMGIVSMVLFGIIMLQSCVVGVSNALTDDTGDTSGSAGVFVGVFMLVAGIVGVATRKSKGGGITAGVFYLLAGIVGIANLGNFGDLVVWAVLSAIFGVVFIAGSVKMQ